MRRNTHYAGVVERLVLARGRRALLVAGAFHLLRRTGAPNETGILERRSPGSVFVVLPHTGFAPGFRDARAGSVRFQSRRSSHSPARGWVRCPRVP